ncbi:solute carrier family 25 member 40-like protein [Chytriomyces sp. MP71]|nr:solute carrier family 25 member 40-like protein [Chytriomyces sp. MP71]
MQAPSTVLYYIGYEEIRNKLMSTLSPGQAQLYAPILAGSLARAGTTIAISPLELIRTRMQAGTGSETSLRGVLGQVGGMVKTAGVVSLWRGLGPTLLRDIPFSAVYWLGYETIKKNLDSRDSRAFGQFGNAFVAGAVSGSFSAFLTTPFDVAKTLQQVVHHDEPGCTRRPLNMLNVMQVIVKNEGVQGLFVGLSPRIAKIAPACAIMISSYELGKRFFEDWNYSSAH